MGVINSMQMEWNFKDQVRKLDLGGGGAAYYVYDASGQRVRKVIETQSEVRSLERVYLGGFEIYREYGGVNTVTLERETLHVIDDRNRIALVETKTTENGSPVNAPVPVQRYQLGNHLRSASLELDRHGALISYEEYHPYGTTAFQAMNSAAEVSLKRYRYMAMERDEESGLCYHVARFYAPWLGRWVSSDPVFLRDGVNLYSFTRANPIKLTDSTGTDSKTSLLDDITNVVYERHRRGGLHTIREFGTKESNAIVSMFVVLGERSLPGEQQCFRNKFSELELFDLGVESFAKRYARFEAHLTNAALRGWKEYERQVASAVSQYDDYVLVDTGYAYAVTPIIGTKKQYEAVQEQRAANRKFAFQDLCNVIGSMGLPGPGGGAETEGPGGRIEPRSQEYTEASFKEETTIVCRFCTVTDPRTMMPRAATASEEAASQGAAQLADPATRASRAHAHAALFDTAESPFLSVLEDVHAGAQTTDPSLRKIITGEGDAPRVERAPHLAYFEVPNSLLYAPANELSRAETELLFLGADLTRFLIRAIPNPF
jgi:RHS repeat-associated protein